MTIDERLEFLVQSTESLHQTVADMHEVMMERHEHERRRRRALLKGLIAFLAALDGDEPGEATQ